MSLTPSHIQKTSKATSRTDNAKKGGKSTQRFNSNKIYLNIKDIDNQKTSIIKSKEKNEKVNLLSKEAIAKAKEAATTNS